MYQSLKPISAESHTYKREEINIKKMETSENYALASKIESGVSLAKAKVTQPIQIHQSYTNFSQRDRLIEQESLVQLEKVNVNIESPIEGNYPLVNKLATIIDAEMIHDNGSCSSEDRSSTSPSITDDTLSNLNLDTFEPVMNSREMIRIDKAKQAIVQQPTELQYVNVTVKQALEKAKEGKVAESDLNYVKSTKHPPLIQDDSSPPLRIPVKVNK